MRLRIIPVRTEYWRPGTDYIEKIVQSLREIIIEGDIVTISEKAISTAKGKIIDESSIKPGIISKFLVDIWIRKIWVYFLARVTNLKDKTIENLRNYPRKEGAAHKQLTLRKVGILQSLRHYSEGGIDASNLPYSYVSLPIENPEKEAYTIRKSLEDSLSKKITVMILDGDTTYSWRNLHLAPRQVDTKHLIHFGGFLAFIFGRMIKMKGRPTPLAISGRSLNPDRALWLARDAHRASGRGAGRTVWGMAERLETCFTEITWEMLDNVEHNPIVVLRYLE